MSINNWTAPVVAASDRALATSPSGNPNRPRKSHGRRHRLALLIASIGAALAVSLAGAGAASADTVPGYGGGEAQAICGSVVHIRSWMLPGLDPWADRFYVKNVTTGVGGWTPWHLIPGGSNDYWNPPLPAGTYQIYVQYAVNTGSSWVYSYGEWINQYQYTKGGAYGLYPYCYV